MCPSAWCIFSASEMSSHARLSDKLCYGALRGTSRASERTSEKAHFFCGDQRNPRSHRQLSSGSLSLSLSEKRELFLNLQLFLSYFKSSFWGLRPLYDVRRCVCEMWIRFIQMLRFSASTISLPSDNKSHIC